MNVALYGDSCKRWAMTERSARHLTTEESALTIGPSSMRWENDALVIDINEVTVPLPSRIHGTIRIHPQACFDTAYAIDEKERHHWQPIAPCARIEVDLQSPALCWSGSAYFDTNSGSEPLENAFTHWDWSRTDVNDGTAVFYDASLIDGTQKSVALKFDRGGQVEAFESPKLNPLSPTGWRLHPVTRSDEGFGARIIQHLEDSPFYARSLLSTQLFGAERRAIHETLSMKRFCAPIVQMMLPFRMPRRR